MKGGGQPKGGGPAASPAMSGRHRPAVAFCRTNTPTNTHTLPPPSAPQRAVPQDGAAADGAAGAGHSVAAAAVGRLLRGGGCVLQGSGARWVGGRNGVNGGPTIVLEVPPLADDTASSNRRGGWWARVPCLPTRSATERAALLVLQARVACTSAWPRTWASRASGELKLHTSQPRLREPLGGLGGGASSEQAPCLRAHCLGAACKPVPPQRV